MEGSFAEAKNDVLMDAPLINDAFLKGIAMSGPGLVAVIRSHDMKVLFVNDQFTHYIGYANADLGSIFFKDLLDDYQHDRFISHLANLKDRHARSNYSIYKINDRFGVPSSYYLYASPMTGECEDMYYLLIQPDLSKWGMPFTSSETKELFLEQFNAEDFGTFEWIIDVDKVYWSAGVYRIYEVDESYNKINNLFARAFIHPADKVWVKEATRRAIETGGGVDIEFKIITASKNVKIVHTLARVIKDNEGNSIKFAGSIRDVTEQRAIENDLKNKVEELNRSNKELEEFAYVASHDLQEPLRKITTFSDRLSERYKEMLVGEGSMYISRMIVAAENMRALINDLLEFSRVTRSDVPFAAVNLSAILLQVRGELELTIEETSTTIQSAPLPVIDAVSSQMKQLFANIINNAIKFHKPGVPPSITIDSVMLTEEEQLVAGLDSGNRYYKICITDNGIGFEPEYAARIFQVFQRLHGKSDYPGSGIGLAICKKIIEYHDGLIYAESQLDRGASFIFILPEKQTKTKD